MICARCKHSWHEGGDNRLTLGPLLCVRPQCVEPPGPPRRFVERAKSFAFVDPVHVLEPLFGERPRFVLLAGPPRELAQKSEIVGSFVRAPCRIRTDDPRFTRAVLWPTELRGH